jgi:hypothetical protein
MDKQVKSGASLFGLLLDNGAKRNCGCDGHAAGNGDNAWEILYFFDPRSVIAAPVDSMQTDRRGALLIIPCAPHRTRLERGLLRTWDLNKEQS